MPYTPPSVLSPGASRPATPGLSRSQSYTKSYQQAKSAPNHGSGLVLPHSTSSRAYLNKHRRSPSISDLPGFNTGLSTPEVTSQEPRSSDSDDADNESRGTGRVLPTSADHRPVPIEISPPASPSTSSDDEATARRGRVRDVSNLAELQAAIRIIEQHRAGSPDKEANEQTKNARLTLGLPRPRIEPSSTGKESQPEPSPSLPLSAGARKISHSRSSTETSAFLDFPRTKIESPGQSTSDSDADDVGDEDLQVKPPLIRKKSGELVRPALRAPSLKRRPSSMPGTPVYSKAVHFQDNSLEHVRHFLQVDRPIAVSAGSSPVESSYEDDPEFPFGSGDAKSRSPPFDWEIRLSNFPHNTPGRNALPVRTESVYLSLDKKMLMGSVIVRNLAFNKLVVARFTLDYWKTTSEVVAEYNNNVRQKQIEDGCDRFTFSIKLEDQANLENKTMFFCVRYNVNGQEYWDNNNSINYQVDFIKRYKSQNGKQGNQVNTSRPLSSLPRSKPSSSVGQRPRSMPSFDDFANMASPYEFSSFPQPSSMVGESPIRFKNKPSAKDIVPDAPGRPKSSANQQAFGNRYDFGASLSATIQAANIASGDRSELPLEDAYQSGTGRQPSSLNKDAGANAMVKAQSSSGPRSTGKAGKLSQQDVPKPAALTTEKPSLQSSSYHELLDKYCFVRSGTKKDTQELVR